MERSVDAQPGFRLPEHSLFRERVIEVDVGDIKGIDANGWVRTVVVVIHFSDPLVEETQIPAFPVVGQANRFGILRAIRGPQMGNGPGAAESSVQVSADSMNNEYIALEFN